MLIIQPFNYKETTQPRKIISIELRFDRAVKKKEKDKEIDNPLITPRQQICISDVYLPIFQIHIGDKTSKKKDRWD
jgi:hypothetical protein